MGRFDDDLHLVPASEFAPTTIDALFQQAGVVDASRDDQAKAIGAHLEAHDLTPMMEFSIRKRGFPELLELPGDRDVSRG